ncbi:MAG: MATE family efflux transporter [Planctomycetes bacterium]|nr:MATE family efflux transporter [Planctomycetota bacterium]
MSAHRSGSLLTKGPLLKATLVFGWPLVAGMAFHSLFNLVDLYIVGQLPDSDVAIAAATIPSLVNSIPMILYNGVVNAAIALVARRTGVGNRRRGNYEAGQGLLLSVLLGVLLGVPPYLVARPICASFDATGAVLEGATTYLEVMSLGTVTMFLLLQVTGTLRAAGNSILPMILLVGANVLNVVLAVWWVFGGLGVPAMGVVGAAWATVVSRGVACLPAMFALHRGFAGMRVRRFAFRWATMAQILRIGIPGCGQLMVRIVQYLYLLKLAAVASAKEQVTAAQAAFGIGLRLDMFAVFSGLGWAAAASTVVGQNLGAGKRERAVRASWIAVGLDGATMLVFAAGYVLFAEPLIRFFGHDVGAGQMDAVVSVGRTYLGLSSAAYVYMAVGLVLSQAMAGAGSTRPSMVIELVGYGLVGFPLAWWVAEHAQALGGLRALWLAAVATHLAVAVAYVVWFRRGTWATTGGLR